MCVEVLVDGLVIDIILIKVVVGVVVAHALLIAISG